MTHPEDFCQECGGRNPRWFASNDVWNKAIPDRVGILCPFCFIQRAEKAGIYAGWELVPIFEPDPNSCRLAKTDQLAVRDESALMKEVVMDIGKQVAHHIEIMYPEAVKAASSILLLSVRNTVYNEIKAAMERDNTERTLQFHKFFRRKQKAAYKKIRASPPVAGTPD